MRWPWARRRPEGVEYNAAAVAAAQSRLRRAAAQSDAIARAADRVIDETSAAEFVSRVARAFRATDD